MATKSLTIQIKGDAKGFKVAIDGVEAGLDGLGPKIDKANAGFAGFAEKLKDLGGKVALAGVAGIGAAFAGAGVLAVKGMGDAIDQGDVGARVAAQLGGGADASAKYGAMAGRLYSQNFGDSVAGVGAAITRVTQDIGEGNEAWMEKITGKALNFASVFEEDVGGATEAVGQMLRNGLAKDADEAFDILTKGMQTGVNKSEDLLDTFNEYGTQFRELGLNGTEAMGILSQGLQGGARDADTVADALKEYAIRAQDGSKLTGEGFAAIGLDAAEMGKAVAAGGDTAKGALQKTLDGLRKIEDPAARNAAAVALFGAKAEDMQDALFGLDPSKATESMGAVAGSADKLGETIGQSLGAKLEAFKRGALQQLTDFFTNTVVPILEEQVPKGIAMLGQAWDTIGPTVINVVNRLKDAVVAAFGGMQTAIAWLGEHKEILYGIAYAIGTVLLIAITLYAASMASAAVATLAALAPFIAIAAAVAAVAAGVIWLFNNWTGFHDFVMAAVTWIQTNVPPAWEAFRLGLSMVVDFMVNTAWPVLRTIFESIGAVVMFLWNWVVKPAFEGIKLIVEAVVLYIQNFVVPVWSKIFEIIGAAANWFWHNVIAPVFGAVQSIISGVADFIVNTVIPQWVGFWANLTAGVTVVQNAIATGFKAVTDTITGVKDWIGRVAGGFWDGLTGGFKSAINFIIDKWNGLKFSLPKLPGTDIGGFDITTPQIARLHTGGTFIADKPGSVGMALLRDREVVSTPGRAAAAPTGDQALMRMVTELANRPIQVVLDRRVLAEATATGLRERETALR